MESKKITQLATEVAPLLDDLTFIGDPITGQLKKVTLNQIAYIFGAGSAWGTITGLLSNQTDLQAALNLKANDSEIVHLAGNETITGFKQFTDINGTWSDYGIAFTKGNIPSFITSSTVNLYSDSGSNNIVSKSIGSSAKLVFDNSTQTYTFPAATGTIALTSDLSSYVTLGTLQTITGNKEFSGFIKATGSLFLKNDLAISVTTGYGTIGFNQVSTTSKLTIASDNSAVSSLIFNNASSYNYTFPSASGTIALTSNLASYVPYTGATSAVNLGGNDLTGGSFIANGISSYSGSISLKQNGLILAYSGYTTLSSSSAGKLNIYFGDASAYAVTLQNNLLTDSRSYDFPNASGTIALTSNLASYVPYTGATANVDLGTRVLTASSITITGGSGTAGNLTLGQSDAFGIPSANYSVIDAITTSFAFAITAADSTYKYFKFETTALTNNTLRIYTLPDASGTIALTSNLTNMVTGSGTTNYLPKFTGASTIGNSAISESGALMTIDSGISTFRFNATNSFLQYNTSLSIGIPASYTAITFNSSGNTIIGGNLLVNTSTDAGYKLDVNGTGRFSGITTFGSTGGSGLRVYGGSGTNQWDVYLNSTNLRFSDNTGTGSIVFDRPLNGTSATFSSSVTATSGIINGTTDAFFDINRSASGNAGRVRFQTAGTDEFEIGLKGGVAGFHITKGDATELVTVLTSGNVGIGTTSPAGLLHISGTTANTFFYNTFSNAANRNWALAFGIGSLGDFNIMASNAEAGNPVSAGTSRFNIQTNGNVGIGTSSPLSKLHVNGTVQVGFVDVSNTAMEFYWNGASSYGRIQTYSSSALSLNPLGNNVLIGTTTDNGYKLDVNGTGRFSNNVLIEANQASSPLFYAKQTGLSGYTAIQFSGNNGTDIGAFTTFGGEIYIGSWNGGNGSLGQLRINKTSGAATFSSSVTAGGLISTTVGDTNQAMKLSAATGFLQFTPYYDTTYGAFINSLNTAASAYLPLTIQGSKISFLQGNVGIGTSSPVDYTGYRSLHIMGATSTSSAILYLTNSTSTIKGLFFTEGAAQRVTIGSQSNHDFTFLTNDTERMRISSGGQVLIGKTSVDLDAGDGIRVDADGSMYASIAAGGETYYVRDITNAAYRFKVSAAGTVFATNTTISSISDERLKENIKDLDIGLDAIMALRPRKYDWKPESGNIGKNVRGFIAQEVEKIFPDLIDESKINDETTYKSLRQDFIPILVKAIQELKAEIEILKNK